MAYIDQVKKKEISTKLEPILAKYNVKGRLSIHNNSTLVFTIKNGSLNFFDNYNEIATEKNTTGFMTVNRYFYNKNFSGNVLEFFTELFAAMNDGNWDNSDYESDYHDIGWYVRVNVGVCIDEPYVYVQPPRVVNKVVVSDIKALMKKYDIKIEELQ